MQGKAAGEPSHNRKARYEALRFSSPGRRSERGPRAVSGPSPIPVKLRITERDQAPVEVEVEGDQVTLGRSSDCDVVVANPYVSKAHLSLFRGLVVLDLGSSNGTWCAGERVEGFRVVQDGRIAIGDEDVVVEVLDLAPRKEDTRGEAHELQARCAGLEHQLEELRNDNDYLRLQVESMRKANATRDAVTALSKAQLEKEGKSLDEFERLQRSYAQVLDRLQSDIDERLKQRTSSY